MRVFDCFQKYSQDKLLHAYKIIKSSFLCFIEPDYDIDFLITSIINSKSKNTELLIEYAKNSTR